MKPIALFLTLFFLFYGSTCFTALAQQKKEQSMGSTVSGSEQELKLLLEKKAADLTEDEISELVKQKRRYGSSAEVWGMVSGTTLGIGIGCLLGGLMFNEPETSHLRGPFIAGGIVSSAVGLVTLFPGLNSWRWYTKIEDKLEAMKLTGDVGSVPAGDISFIAMKGRF